MWVLNPDDWANYVAQSHIFSFSGQVHYDFMCSVIGPAGRLFASFHQVETCPMQVVWNHGPQVPCSPRHSSQQVLFVGVLAVLVAIKHAALLMTFWVVCTLIQMHHG